MIKQNSLSFLSRFDPSEFYDIAKDLPNTIELENEIMNNQNNNTNTLNQTNNVQIIGTHLLVPQSSISQVLDVQFDPNNFQQNTFIDLQPFSNFMSDYQIETKQLTDLPTASNIPSVEPLEGIYDFKVNIASVNEKNTKKSVSWTYSKVLNKLYCLPAVSCPINLSVNKMPSNGSLIRATAVYSNFEHRQNLIKRCENHKKSKEFDLDSDVSQTALSHLIRCQHPKVIYFEDQTTCRHSVMVPFEKPPTGSNYTTLLYQFMCYSSCIGGSKKPVKIVITLENNGEILGRDSFELKICASPGRDRSIDEKKITKQKLNSRTSSTKSDCVVAAPDPKKPDNLPLPSTNITNSDKNKEIKNQQIKIKSIGPAETLSNKDDEIFTIQVKGRKNYEIIKRVYEALEFETKYSQIINSKKSEPSSNHRSTNDEVECQRKNLENLRNDFIKKISNTNGSQLHLENNYAGLKRKHSDAPIVNSLEQFLDKIEMSAYYNLIVSKGVKNLEDLLKCDKKKINNFKISQPDTKKLWDAILNTRKTNSSTLNNINELDTYSNNEQENPLKRLRSFNPKPKTLELSKSLSKTDSKSSFSLNSNFDLVEISKYEIKCSFDFNLLNDFP